MSKKTTPILIAVVLGAIALTPVVINSFSDNPSFPKIGKTEQKSTTINAESDIITKVSYGFGYTVGKNLSQETKELKPELIAQGLKDAFENKDPSLSTQEIEKAVQEYQVKLQNEMQQKMLETAKNNLEKGQAFLAENGKKPNIKTTESGLQYEVLQEGTGENAKATDTVVALYEGKLLNGEVFDSSAKNNNIPFTFKVNEMIPGWIEGIQLMNKGAKYRLFVPANLAYGEMGVPMGGIEPNSVLIFEVEILDINPKTK